MKSKLLPIADLNAILLSIFLVLSLGSSRGIIKNSEAEMSDRLQLELTEMKSESALSFVPMLWSGGSYQFDFLQRRPTWIDRVPKKTVDSAAAPNACNFPIVLQPSHCHLALFFTAQLPTATIREGGVCKPIAESLLGKSLKRIVEQEGMFFQDDRHTNLEGGGPSVSFNNFSLAAERQLTVTALNSEQSREGIEAFGAACAWPRTLPANVVKGLEKCKEPDLLVTETIENVPPKPYVVSKADLAAQLMKSAEIEGVMTFKARMSSFEKEGSAEELSLELVGRSKDGQSRPDYVLFPSNEACEAPPMDGLIVQLFGVTISSNSAINLFGLRRLN